MKYLGQNRKGFTLIEFIVAMGIFTFTSTAAVTAMITVLDANRQTRSTVRAMDSLSFVLESMTRELRVGRSYYCDQVNTVSIANKGATQDCSREEHIGFVTDDGDFMEYRLDNGAIERRIENSSWVAMTGSDVTIDAFDVYVYGSDPVSALDYEQPRVLITTRGTAGAGSNASRTFTLQATITQRFPDF